jgi:four helix bundle protein
MSLYFDANSFFMQQSIVAEKSYRFSVKIVGLHRHICQTEKYVYGLSVQLLRSGTAVGANIEEALGGHTRKDFAAKMSIAYKEAREVHYWIRLMTECGLIETSAAEACLQEADELIRILATIVKSSK